MAFTPLTLFRIGGNHGMQGPSLWLYSTADTMATAAGTDYFQACKYQGMNVGDVIVISKPGGPNAYIAFVNAIDSDGNATVSAGTTVS
jgi:hypothetical protein